MKVWTSNRAKITKADFSEYNCFLMKNLYKNLNKEDKDKILNIMLWMTKDGI